jgi:murein DD-endopeptidase MepM/ murein hydrolase activator NlpD
MGADGWPGIRVGIRIGIAVSVGVFAFQFALALPAVADVKTVFDGDDTPSPLDIRSAGHGHLDASTVTAKITTWQGFRARALRGPDVVAVGFYRHRLPYRWLYVFWRAGALRARIKRDNGESVGSVRASRPSNRKIIVQIPETLLGNPAGYRWVAFTAFRNGGACARTCTDAVRSIGGFVKTGVLTVRPTLHDLTAPSIRLLRFPDPSTRQSATLRYRVRFSVRDRGGAHLRGWRLKRRVAGASQWHIIARGSRGGRKAVSLTAAQGFVYEHRLVAADREGNRRSSRVAHVAVPFDDANAAFASSYAGTWKRGMATGMDFRGTLHSSSQSGASFTYSFTGTAVAWIGAAANGVATVSTDGGPASSIDLSSFAGRRQVLFETALSVGRHTITIRDISGTVDVDGLVVRNGSASGRATSLRATTASFVPTTRENPIEGSDDGLECTGGQPADDLCASASSPRTLPRTYADSWYGWPVRPLHRQHPVRGSFLDPRAGGFHFGIDINVRDDRPERGAPRGRTHRVYAVEGGTVYNLIDGVSPCSLRRVWVGHFAYYHVDAVVSSGQHVSAGQMIGWTCRGEWHVHLSELTAGGALVNPLHPGGKLRPYTDTKRPVIHAFRFFRRAPPLWTNPGGAMWSPTTGRPLAPESLSGIVDVRVWMSDPQSFRGWLTRRPELYADLHPYRAVVSVVRLRDGRRLLRHELFNAFFPYSLPLNNHFAPGTRANRQAAFCYRHRRRLPVPCPGRYWVHAFGTPARAYWDTRSFANGRYRIRVRAWDPLGHGGSRGIDVRIHNG